MAGRTRRPLGRALAFWDSSALIPLCVHQGSTSRVRILHERYDVVVWWTTPVEIASGLARLARMREISFDEFDQAGQLIRRLADTWFVVQPSNSLRNRAVQLVGSYELRAADSLQLAAALEWCQIAPQGRAFLTTDQRLRHAALRCGFDAATI